MKWTRLVVSLFLMSCSPNKSDQSLRLDKDFAEFLANRVQLLMDNSFGKLNDFDINIKSLASDNDFAATDVEGIFKDPASRKYLLLINPTLKKLATTNPLALDALLAHELSHIMDYTSMSSWGLIGLGLEYLMHDESYKITAYEKKTDAMTIRAGYGPGLIEFRKWLYQELGDSEAIERKKRIYYTPVEISEIMNK